MALICTQCGKPNSYRKYAKCPRCRKNKNWKYLEDRFLNGMCMWSDCPNKRSGTARMCKTCWTKRYEVDKRRRIEIGNNGLCMKCKKNNSMAIYLIKTKATNKLCQTCYLKATSIRYFGSENYYEELLEMLKKQDFRCVYSGEALVLGDNDSIDHILPQNKHPDKKGNISNVQWITRDVNRMKTDFNETKFIDLVRKISKNCKILQRITE